MHMSVLCIWCTACIWAWSSGDGDYFTTSLHALSVFVMCCDVVVTCDQQQLACLEMKMLKMCMENMVVGLFSCFFECQQCLCL